MMTKNISRFDFYVCVCFPSLLNFSFFMFTPVPGCPASYFFLLFHKIPIFSYFLALEGKISSYFLLFS